MLKLGWASYVSFISVVPDRLEHTEPRCTAEEHRPLSLCLPAYPHWGFRASLLHSISCRESYSILYKERVMLAEKQFQHDCGQMRSLQAGAMPPDPRLFNCPLHLGQ